MKRLAHRLAQVLPGVASLVLLALLLRRADLARAWDLVHGLGWGLPLLVLPNLAAMVLEAHGWRLSFRRLGAAPRFWPLLGVRVCGDALILGLPSGSVVSESVQPYLLRTRCGLPLETGIVATVARKFLVVLSHGLFLATGTLLAWPLLERASRAAIGRGGLPWALLATAVVLASSSAALAATIGRGRAADRVHAALQRVGGRWIGSWLERNARRFRRTDDSLVAFFSRPFGSLAAALVFYLAGWLVRSLETVLFLRLVGVDLPLSAAMVVETALILVRAAAVPVPAGLGIQDAGYVLCLQALGLPDATTVGTAFVLLKRGRDLFWVAAGFLLLGVDRRRVAPAEPPAVVPPRPS